jgi:hypothetical protein
MRNAVANALYVVLIVLRTFACCGVELSVGQTEHRRSYKVPIKSDPRHREGHQLRRIRRYCRVREQAAQDPSSPPTRDTAMRAVFGSLLLSTLTTE